jgi:nucleotidyltransferase-like protein
MTDPERMRVAQTFVDELAADRATVAVLLVGSSLAEQALPSSDIDILVVREGPGQGSEVERQLDGFQLGIEQIPITEIDAVIARAPNALAPLRFAGRIAEARLLWARDSHGQSLIDRAAAMKPSAKLLTDVVAHGHANLASAHGSKEPADTILFTRASAQCAVTAILSSAAPFFNQPKWIFRDLRRRGETMACEAFERANGVADATALTAVDALADLRMFQDQAPIGSAAPSHRLLVHLEAKAASQALDFAEATRYSEAIYTARLASLLRLATHGPLHADARAAHRRMQETAEFEIAYEAFRSLHGLDEANHFTSLEAAALLLRRAGELID